MRDNGSVLRVELVVRYPAPRAPALARVVWFDEMGAGKQWYTLQSLKLVVMMMMMIVRWRGERGSTRG